MATNLTIKDILRRYVNKAIKGRFTSALLAAIAVGDDINKETAIAVKENLYISTASGSFLEKLLAGIGVIKPPGVGIDDDVFRELGIKQTTSKLVKNIFLDVLEIFYGSDAVRANVESTRPEGYVLEDGMTLKILVDSNTNALIVTFNAADFTSISNATAAEISNIISRDSFNSGFTLTAEPILDSDSGLTSVRLISGTKGPKSAITVIGGEAQNIMKFPAAKTTSAKVGTEIATSFSGQFIRFTYTAGPDPGFSFLNPGDYVNIFGDGYSSLNQGSFFIENVQGGPAGTAFFEIINPTFAPQGPVTLSAVGGASGQGTVERTVLLDQEPTGAVRASGITTITTAVDHDLIIGQSVTIDGVNNTSFNGTFTITATPTATTFTYIQGGVDASSGGGEVSVTVNIDIVPSGAVRSTGTSTVTTTTSHNLMVGQSVNVSGVQDSSFNGIFTIVTTPTATTFTYVQDGSNDLTFFNPVKTTLQKLPRFATVYEVNPYEVVVFLPATTRIVKRELIGSWHVHNSQLDKTFLGSYIFNPTEGFSITKTATSLSEDINAGDIKTVITGADTEDFPDKEGFLVFEYGATNQEGPVKYLGRPSNGSLLIDPSYKFQKNHDSGVDISLIFDRKPYRPKVNGDDYQAFLTGTISGRIEAENLIEKLAAAGIFLEVFIVFPEGPGLHDVENYVYAGDFT